MRIADPIKTTYDRLYRKGIKVSRDQIRMAFDEIGMDSLNANSEQVDCVVHSFLQSEKQITISSVEGTLTRSIKEEYEKEEIIEGALFSQKEETLEIEEKIEGSLVLTQSQKIQMVQEQSTILGVQLDNDQIHSTASMMVSNYASFEESIEEVKGLIIQVLNQQRNKAEEKLVSSLNEIADTASQGFESLTERSSQGFGLIMNQLKNQETDFKSKTGSLKDQLRSLLT